MTIGVAWRTLEGWGELLFTGLIQREPCLCPSSSVSPTHASTKQRSKGRRERYLAGGEGCSILEVGACCPSPPPPLASKTGGGGTPPSCIPGSSWNLEELGTWEAPEAGREMRGERRKSLLSQRDPKGGNPCSKEGRNGNRERMSLFPPLQ